MSLPSETIVPHEPVAASGDILLLAGFLNGIPDLASIKDVEGRYLAVNRAMERFLGKRASEIVGRTDFALFPAEQARRLAEEDRAALESAEPLTFEDEIQGADQTVFVQTVRTVCRSASGTILGVMSVARDVSERKMLDQRLREQERELAEARHLASVGTWRWDAATDTVTWSEEVYKIFGRDPGFKPDGHRQLLEREGPESVRELAAAFDRAVRFGESYSVDMEVVLPGAPSRWIIARGQVERWENGKVASLRGTVQDITERKQLEIALRKRERELMEAHRMAGIGTWEYDCATGLTTWSPEIYRMYGMQVSEPPLRYADFLKRTNHTEADLRFIEAFERLLATGEPYTLDIEMHLPDGSTRWNVSRGEVDQRIDGRVARLRGTVHEITERKLQEQQLALSENRYRSLVHASSQMVWTADAAGSQMNAAPGWQAFTGQREEEFLGLGWAEAIHPQDRSNALAKWRESIAKGEPHVFEERLRRHDGVYRHMAVHAVPVRDRSGKIVEWVGTHTDITERKEAQEQLRQAHERLANVLDSITDGLCVLDHEFRYIYYNENGARMTGIRVADVIGKQVGDLYADNKTNRFGRSYRRAMETGETIHFEEFYPAPVNKWFELNCYPSALGLTIYFRDVTERKRTEAALREREERFRLLSESLPQLVWMSDPVGSLTYLNQRFLDFCGISADEMLGFDWQKILHPEEMDRVNDKWTHCVRTGEPYLIELRMRCHDGSFRYFLARALVMRNDAGTIERWVGSCTDVHDQKLAEEALRRSEKLAATGRLAASIAHEINNPLSSVFNSLYLAMQDETLDAETRGYLNTAQDELARVSHITTQTLRFHRQSKAASFSDLSETMQSVLMLFRPRFAARHVEIVTECDAGARICCFDDELRQVFANLVSNSLDATPDRGRLRIRVRIAEEHGVAGVRVTVGDTGSGIPKAIQKRIFEPFFSTKDTTGIGLGLWVSDGIIRKHSGRLRLRTSTDPLRHGTVFSLFFPANGVEELQLSGAATVQ
jgi:PAS domain S-box-containing protein